MAPLVRTGGSRHTGLAALPHRNIHYRKLIYYDIKKLNTPKVQNIQQLFKNYFGISENEIDDTAFPFKSLDDIISTRGDVAHNIYSEKYLRKGKLLEYVDTIKACVLEMDKLLYK